jgi:glycosyltransferase involved in cell wall biosynthesis
MKILYISHHLKGNDGWSRYTHDLIAEIQRNGTEVLCLVNEIDSKTNIPQKACLRKEPLAYVANPFVSFFNAIEINKIIKNYQPDIIHIIVEPYGTMVPFLRKGNSKIIISVHSTFAFLPILVKGIRRIFAQYMAILTFKKIDSIIAISKYTEEHLRKHMSAIKGLKYIENKISVINGGVASTSIDKSPRTPLTNFPKEILFVGALKPRKGLIEAIEALAHVKTDFIYRIVGAYNKDNSYIKLIQKKIAEYKLTGKIILIGSISDEELKNMYKKADLFLMLSTNNGADFEGYGLVYLEANGRGVPTIGPSDSGVSDAIISGKTGYLVDQYDSPTVAKIIDNVLQNNIIKAKDCIAWAWKNRSEAKAKEIFKIYTKLLSQ